MTHVCVHVINTYLINQIVHLSVRPCVRLISVSQTMSIQVKYNYFQIDRDRNRTY